MGIDSSQIVKSEGEKSLFLITLSPSFRWGKL
jgi:hypothetical protein